MTNLLLLLLLAAPDRTAELAKIVERNAKLPYEQRDRADAIRKLGRIGSPASTKILIGLLDDAFAHQQDNAVSALIQLKKSENREASVALLAKKLAKSRSETVRRHLCTALGLIGDPTALAALSGQVQSEAGAVALSRIGGEKAVMILRGGTARKESRAHCVRALGFQADQEGFIRQFATDADDAVRAAVVDALVRSGSQDVPRENPGEMQGIALAEALPQLRDVELAKALLAHDSWRVRAAAIQGCRDARRGIFVAPLVVRLGNERGRLRFDVWNALRALTGKEIPPDPEQWRAILPWDGPAPDAAGATPGHETKTRAYFGLPVASERIAFVFDVSGSMRDDGKIEQARAQFAKTAATLGNEQRYDLFVYRYLLKYPPRPKLERAFGKLQAGRGRKANGWLKKQPARGGGAIYDGLVAAMLDPEVDTIYLLSDGVPSYGTVSRDYRVRQEVRRVNRWRRVAIHTILLGTRGTDRKFMLALATENGGFAVGADGKPLR
ncbi:MAG: hypothetical protein AAGD14_16715 [Planctomycetota bacterium]